MKKKTELVDKEVGARLRTRRNMLRITQQRLGSEIGISFQQVQKYEKGINRIGASRLRQIAIVLDVPVEYFFDGALIQKDRELDNPMADVSDFIASSDGTTLLRSFAKIANPIVRRRLVNLVEALAEGEALGS